MIASVDLKLDPSAIESLNQPALGKLPMVKVAMRSMPLGNVGTAPSPMRSAGRVPAGTYATISKMSQPVRDIERAELPNGLVIVTEKMPHVRSVSVGIWLGTGSRGESPERNGIAHFIEHMVFKGTERRTAEEIAQAVDSVGGMLDAFTAKEMTCFNAKVLDEHLPVAFDVLSDLVLRPRFDDADIAKEKQVVLEEIKMDEDNPEYLIHEMFTQNFWRGHPLGLPILGTPETVPQFSSGALLECFARVVCAEQHRDHGGGKSGTRAAGGSGRARIWRRGAGRPPRRRAQRRETHAVHRAAQQEGTRAGAHRAGRAVVSAGARAALRGVAAEYYSRRRDVLAAVSEHPRAAGAGLRDRQRPVSVHRFGRAFGVCGNVARIRGAIDPFGGARNSAASSGSR